MAELRSGTTIYGGAACLSWLRRPVWRTYWQRTQSNSNPTRGAVTGVDVEWTCSIGQIHGGADVGGILTPRAVQEPLVSRQLHGGGPNRLSGAAKSAYISCISARQKA